MVECVSQMERKKGRKERKKEKSAIYTRGIRTHTSCNPGKCTTTVLWEAGEIINTYIINILWSGKKQRCRDGVMNDFLSWRRHLFVPFLFHAMSSLHPPSFDIFHSFFSFFIMEQSGDAGLTEEEDDNN